jgi:hypothetical protein
MRTDAHFHTEINMPQIHLSTQCMIKHYTSWHVARIDLPACRLQTETMTALTLIQTRQVLAATKMPGLIIAKCYGTHCKSTGDHKGDTIA